MRECMERGSFDAIVIGSGAACFNAANRIREMGKLNLH